LKEETETTEKRREETRRYDRESTVPKAKKYKQYRNLKGEWSNRRNSNDRTKQDNSDEQ
jgi:hypothetical protein